jgi:hypothetical protein
MPRLENWIINYDETILANIYNDERFDDGTLITTSKIQSIDRENNVATTENTTYELGQEYIDLCDLMCT